MATLTQYQWHILEFLQWYEWRQIVTATTPLRRDWLQALLDGGWIEAKYTGDGGKYRLTAIGIAAKRERNRE